MNSLLTIGVLRVLLQHVHHFMVELLRGRPVARDPVVDFPIVGRQVDETIVQTKLLRVHQTQMFRGKASQQESVL